VNCLVQVNTNKVATKILQGSAVTQTMLRELTVVYFL